jgi:hypothetical protein
MRKFDYRDFAANPGKYQLFSTARIASHIFTNNSERDLEEGAIFGIRYIGTEVNRLYRREEPVYTLIGDGRKVFGHNLADFVL